MNKGIKVDYDLRLYFKKSVIRAVADYKYINEIKVIQQTNDILQLTFEASSDLEEMVGEFNNYLIQIENSHEAI